MTTLPPVKNQDEMSRLGPWLTEKSGYRQVSIFRGAKESNGLMLFIEGLKDTPKQLAQKCSDVSVLDSVDSKGGPNALYIAGDIFEFIEVALREGFLMGPMTMARNALNDLTSPPSETAHNRIVQCAQRRWGAAQLHKSTL